MQSLYTLEELHEPQNGGSTQLNNTRITIVTDKINLHTTLED